MRLLAYMGLRRNQGPGGESRCPECKARPGDPHRKDCSRATEDIRT